MKSKIKAIILNIYKLIFWIVGRILPKHEKLIIFESFLGKQYSDNPRAIYEYLKENHPEYKLYWSFNKDTYHSYSQLSVMRIKRFSIKWLYFMNRAKYWVSNSRMPLWIPKPKATIYIQTWHGTPLKKLATDMEEVYMPGTDTNRYKRNFLIESSKWDYLISPNAYSTEIFKRAFQYRKKLLETGYPRNDYLIRYNNEKEIEKIKRKLNLPEDKKIILYAPTWRDNQYYGIGRYKFDIPINLDLMQDQLGVEYIVMLRLHYLVAEEINIQKYEGFIYDVSEHLDIRELYLIADMLITDYSSVFFDYANLKRPMLFYTYDIEEYRDELRGFYFDFENNAPGPLIQSTDELIQHIQLLEREFRITDNIQTFYENFCYLEDGRATERVVNTIFRNEK